MLSILFIVLASIFDAARDKLDHHYKLSIFSRNKSAKWAKYWNPKISWRNKYKWLVGNKKVPKFFGSTTFLVWTTDAWHLFQFIELKFILLAVVFYRPVLTPVLDFFMFWGIYAAISEIFYKFVLHDNSKKS